MITDNQEVYRRSVKSKEERDLVRIGHSDVIKFGRVRFRVKKLVVTQSSKAQDPT